MTSGLGDMALDPAFLSAALDELPGAALITDEAQRIVYVNVAFERLTGHSRATAIGRNPRFLQGPDTDPATRAEIAARLGAGEEYRGEILNRRADGSPFWNRMAVTPMRDASGSVIAFVGALVDTSADVVAVQSSADARDTGELLLSAASRLATASALDTITQTVADTILGLGVDRACVALLDEDRETLRITGHAGWPPELVDAVDHYRSTTRPQELAEILARPRPLLVDGSTGSEWARRECARFDITGFVMVPIWAPGQPSAPRGLLGAYWSAAPPPDPVPRLLQDRLTGLAGLAAVALDSMELVDRSRHAADRDVLTGSASRSRLHELLREALARPGGAAGVLYGDVDHFKRINDSLGHAAGDQLLRQVARRLDDALHQSGTLGRPGGDEFVAVLPGSQRREDLRAAVHRLEAAMQAPFDIDGRRVYVTLSFGSASARREPGEEPDEVAEALMRAADTAMYRIKQRRPEIPTSYGDFDPLRLDSELHAAIESGGIEAHFQAQFDVATGRVTGYEALARWHHPELGRIEPAVFIPLAESTGLIRALGVQMLQRACGFAEAASAGRPIRVQVNVSTRELIDPSYARDVLATLARYPDRRWELGLEVTESALIVDREAVGAQLRRLEAHGVVIAIDDFGTGYSSLAHLQDLPARELKIDRSFVQREGALADSLLSAIIALAHSLRLQVIGEGIETEQQLAVLRRLGCDRVQGHLLARPLPPEEALAVTDAAQLQPAPG